MKHRTKKRRSRKMGALNPGSTVMKVAAVAAGYFLGDQINTAIDSVTAKVMPVTPAPPPAATGALSSSTTGTIVMAAEVGLGGLLLLKGRKTMVKTIAGGLLAGAGIKRAMKQFGMISGYQSVPVLAGRRIRGYQNTPVLAGTMPSALTGGFRVNGNGMPPQLSGFRVNGNQKVMGNTGDGGSGYRDN